MSCFFNIDKMFINNDRNANTSLNLIEGLEEVKKYYTKINSLLKKGDEVLVMGARHGNSDSNISIDFFVNYMDKRCKLGIKTKLIFNNDIKKEGESYKDNDLVQVRYMPLGLVTKVSIDIYKDRIDMLNWVDPKNPKIVVIEDSYIADSYREYFNLLWSSATIISDLEEKGNYYLPEILFEDYINNTTEKSEVEPVILDILNNKKPKNLLNIGAGPDTIFRSKDIPKSLKKVTFLEKNTGYVLGYKDKKIEVVHDDFENWNTDQKFDVILMSHVLFYFKDKDNAIKKIHSLLNKGGIAIIISMDSSLDYKKIKDLFFGLQGKTYTYSRDLLLNILKKFNYSFEERKIDCKILGTSKENLYKTMRLWFEMDLKNYFKFEKEVKDNISDKGINYKNSIVIIKK